MAGKSSSVQRALKKDRQSAADKKRTALGGSLIAPEQFASLRVHRDESFGEELEILPHTGELRRDG